MKYIIGITIFLYYLIQLYKTGSSQSLHVIGLFVIIFSIKYIRKSKLLKNSNKICNNYLSKQKNEFIETLNHDLKIPILAQLRGLELMKNEILGELNNNQSEMIEQIEYSCKYTLEMISMLANTYMYENNNYKFNIEVFSITELLISCFDNLANRAKEKNLTFSYTSESKDTIIEGDKNGIKKVILNLLINAINHSHSGGEIIVNINSNDKKIFFSISGMELSDTYFIQKSSKTNYTTIGHDIGMELCKKIIEFHQGKIFISKHPQKTLTFVIPKSFGHINQIPQAV